MADTGAGSDGGSERREGPREGARDPDALRRRAGTRGDPGRDQHFLVDDRVLDRIPEYADDFDLDRVLEIGAGTGALTDRLLDAADAVIAVERDPELAAFLREEFATAVASGRLRVIGGDALEIDVPGHTASVSNLPYGVASELLFRLLPRKRPLVAMVQQEFAERMAADPGTEAYGRLSVASGHYGEVEVVEPVPREAFDPPPEVESALVRVTPREPAYDVEERFFLRFVKAVFTQRRKTTRNAIRNTTHISGIEDPSAVVEATEESLLAARPGTLSPEQFATLANTAIEAGGVRTDADAEGG
ncbi:MAG: 16S ribosomal RNA methyltransferase A [Halobacteriales archaeon]